eukprot:gene18580-biopygen21962
MGSMSQREQDGWRMQNREPVSQEELAEEELAVQEELAEQAGSAMLDLRMGHSPWKAGLTLHLPRQDRETK